MSLLIIVVVLLAIGLVYARAVRKSEKAAEMSRSIADLWHIVNALNERLRTVESVLETSQEDHPARKAILPPARETIVADIAGEEPLPTVKPPAIAQPKPVARPLAPHREVIPVAPKPAKERPIDRVRRRPTAPVAARVPARADVPVVEAAPVEAPKELTAKEMPAQVAAPKPMPTPAQAEPWQPGRPTVGANWEALRAALKRLALKRGDWESIIGTSWLNVIGIVVLVVGFVLLTQHSIRQFGPVGRITTGAMASIGLIGMGLLLERSARYRLISLALMGGGWALVYFVAYAAHNIEAARVVDDAVLGLVVMLLVASGMILHSLRYRSELLTGIAYGLGFFAILLTPLTTFSLIAIAVLAASQLALIRAFSWYMPALIAMAGTYLTHARWLAAMLDVSPLALGGALPPTSPFALGMASSNFWVSQTIIVLNWSIFAAAPFVRRQRDAREQFLGLVTCVTNTIGMLALSGWQIWAIKGDHLYLLTGSAVLAYAAMAAISRKTDRRDLYRFNSTIGVALYAVSLPLALKTLSISSDWLAPYWTLGTLAIVIIGYRLSDATMRFEAYGLAALAMLGGGAFNLSHEAPPLTHPIFWVIPVVAGSFFLLSDWLQRSAGRHGLSTQECEQSDLLSYGATLLYALFLIWGTELELLGLVASASSLCLFEAGRILRRTHMRLDAYALLATGALASIVTLATGGQFDAALLKYSAGLTILPVLATHYYVYWRTCLRAPLAGSTQGDTFAATLASYVAATILAILLWAELPRTGVALAWMGFALVLLEAGRGMAKRELRIQCYILLTVAFTALLLVNLNEVMPWSWPAEAWALPSWLIASICGAGYYYVYWRVSLQPPFAGSTQVDAEVGILASYAAAIVLAILIWIEAPPTNVALIWMGYALVLLEVGRRLARNELRNQSYAFLDIAFFVLVVINLYELVPQVSLRPESALPSWLVVSVCAAGYYYASWRMSSDRGASSSAISVVDPTKAPTFASAFLLGVLIWKEVDAVAVALGWGILGLALFEVGVAKRIRELQWQGHALAAAALVRIFMTNLLVEGDWHGLSLRILGVAPIILLYYYLYAHVRGLLASGETSAEVATPALPIASSLSKFYSFGAAALALALARFELGRDYWVAGLAPLCVLYLVAGWKIEDRDFRYQAFVVAILMFARSWTTNFHLIGTLWGYPERLVTMLPALAAFLACVAVSLHWVPQAAPPARAKLAMVAQFIDEHSPSSFMLLAALFGGALIYYEFPVDLVTIGWATEAFALIVLGFLVTLRSFRLYGLALLLVALGKLVIIDMSGVDPLYRIASYIVLGALLLLASVVYARKGSAIKEYL